MRHSLRRLGTTALACALAACGTDSGPSTDAGPSVVVERLGDTTVVRTLAGSAWGAEATLVQEVSIGELDGPDEYLFGSIWSLAVDDDRNVYVFDQQAHNIRVFDATGAYIETLGGRGGGPGELGRPEAMALTHDGRVVVRDPGNQRVQAYGPGPGETDEWSYEVGGTYSSAPLYTDARGRTFLQTRDLSRTEDFVMHIIVLGPDGAHLDTLPLPSSPSERAELVAEHTTERGRMTSRLPVPFDPVFQWAIHPSGHFLSGLPSAYRIDLARDDGVLRIERTADPVPLSDEERAARRERTTRMMRDTDPNWSWNGPPIPDHKPFYRELLAGRDGRIWVRLQTAGNPVENEDHDPESPYSMPVEWVESVRYDVFEPDGTYLGVVRPPDDFKPRPRPVFDGDHVWAVTEDELGVERVARYRIDTGGS